jgi:hypothetical protein
MRNSDTNNNHVRWFNENIFILYKEFSHGNVEWRCRRSNAKDKWNSGRGSGFGVWK